MKQKLLCLLLVLALAISVAIGVQASEEGAVCVISGLETVASYDSIDAALAANHENVSRYQLTKDLSGGTISRDILLDLNGCQLTDVTVAEGVTVRLMDSANDQYQADKCGSLSGTVNGTVEQVVKHDANAYLVIEENGVYSAHRFYAGITRISLEPSKVALGYKAEYYADAVINEMVTGYGYQLWVNDYNPIQRIKGGSIADNELTLRLQNILVEGSEAISNLGATAIINGNAIICFNVDGQELTVTGADHSTTLKDTVEAVNEALGQNRSAYTTDQVALVREMYNKFSAYMNGWQVKHILAVEKFAPQSVDGLVYGQTVTLGQLFAAVESEYPIGTVVATVNGEEITVAENWADTVLFLNAGTAEITITDDNYCIPASNTVEVAKADPEVEPLPSFTATYGQTLAEIALPEHFRWEDASLTVGEVGDRYFNAWYDLNDPNYHTASVSVHILVSPAQPTFEVPTGLNATYGDDLSTVALPSGFTWESTGSVGFAGVNTHFVTYTPADTTNYNVVTGIAVTVTVAKADPEVPAVGTLNATYGDDLSTVVLPNGFTWKSTGSVGNAGINSFIAIYNNGDANYNTAEVTVSVEVAKAEPEVPTVGTLNATYGQTLADVTLPDGFSWVDSTASVGNAGTQTHTAIYNAGENYNTVEVSVTIEVAKADPQVPEVGTLYATYGDHWSSVEVPAGFFIRADGMMTVGDAGERTVTLVYTPADGNNYNCVDVEVTLVVAKAQPVIEAPTVSDFLVYNGAEQALLSFGGSVDGCVILYSLTENGEFTMAMPTAVNAGSYTVYYMAEGNDNYESSAVASVVATIQKAESQIITNPTANNSTYSGVAQTLVSGGSVEGGVMVYSLTQDGEYTQTVPTATDAGVYTVYCKVKGDANHKDSDVSYVYVDIAMADPSYTVPTGLTATEGDKLSSVALTEGFAWGDGSVEIALGEHTYVATFTPADTTNYNTVTVNITVTGEAKVVEITDKFAQKMPEAEFTYRLGNGNAVALGALVEALEGAQIDSASVSVSVSAVDSAVVSGTYTANSSDWTKGTIQFAGTGVVNVTIKDATSNEFTLTFEIVNAMNATSAAKATANNVVLLNNCGFSTIEVSNGYTLFGNGFTMTCSNDISYYTANRAFVEMENGTLDNVRIVTPNLPQSVLYMSQATGSEGYLDYQESGGAKYCFCVRAAVLMKGNSKILNSYISGGRAGVYIVSGDALLDNSTIYGGAAANIHVVSPKSVTLRDMTLIQKPIQANVHDISKTVMGFSVLINADGATGAATPVTLEGYLNQFAWANEDYASYVPSDATYVLDAIKEQTDYLHNITVDGVSHTEWVNLGIAYMPAEVGAASVVDPIINDNRTDTSTSYGRIKLTVFGTSAYVYSIKKSDSIVSVTTPEEKAITNNAMTAPKIEFTDLGDGKEFTTSYDETNGWMSELKLDLDTIGNYTLDFSNLVVSKYGKPLNYTVTDENGTTLGSTVAIDDSGVRTYTLHITDDVDCNEHGTVDHVLSLRATKTSIAAPEKVAEPGGTPLLVVKAKNSDWSCALPALEGTQIKYYSKSAGAYTTLSLSSLTPTSTGKQNGTNNFWTYTGSDFSLTVTCGVIHEGKQIYGMPVVVNNGGNKMYFTISSTDGYMSTNTTARTVTLTYEFTDANGQTLTFSKTWQFNYADYKSGTQYSYSDFVNGNLKAASSGCFTADTLITMADGSQKQVQYVTAEDLIQVWDFYTGEYAIVPAVYVMNHGYGDYTIAKLIFSDGTVVKTINSHGFFDVDANEFVFIDETNAADYVGHSFQKQSGKGFETVTLVDYEVYTEYTESWSILSYKHYNCIIEGMLSITPHEGEGNFFMPFEVGAEMKFDEAQMQSDIETYGLYTYEEFADVMSKELFDALNMPYVKVAVGKGITSEEDIWFLLNLHFGIERP